MHHPIPKNAWCEIYLDRFSKNLELALDLVPQGTRFCAVLKADAYGHGISQTVPLVREQGVDCIGITSNSEAREVRNTGFAGSLIRLRAATQVEIDQAVHDRVEEQVGSLQTARYLSVLIKSGRYQMGAHLSLNAKGMSRDGLEISTVAGQETCRRIVGTLGEKIVGICSHFPSNDKEHLRQNSKLFQQQVDWVLANSKLKRKDLLIHAGSSLTLISEEHVKTDMFRCGAILYGILKPELGFLPTMELKARVVSIGDYPMGTTVGYDRSKLLEQDGRLACISIGYANGFRRNGFERSIVSINGNSCPVVGKISMNTIVADVTEMKEVQVGDEVVIFGGAHANKIGRDSAEHQFETIMADLYSDWGLRNPRKYR